MTLIIYIRLRAKKECMHITDHSYWILSNSRATFALFEKHQVTVTKRRRVDFDKEVIGLYRWHLIIGLTVASSL